MDSRVRAIAESLGAKIVAELPDPGHGALGATHYAAFYCKRMHEVRRELDPGGAKSRQLAVPVDEATLRALEVIPAVLWPGQKIDAAGFTAGLLKRMSLVILDQLLKHPPNDQEAAKNVADMKAALLDAIQDVLDRPEGRQAAG